MNGVFLCFLIIGALQDYYWKQVEVRVFVLFGSIGICYTSFLWMQNPNLQQVQSFLIALIPGMILICASFLGKDAIGLGDGLFFLISATMLESEEVLLLFLGGFISCGIWSLYSLVKSVMKFGMWNKKETIPFLPFLLPVGLWMIMIKVG